MLQRRTAGNGVVYYASPLLEKAGVPHAFSTRHGGISPAPFDSLNLGNPNNCGIQDDYERIWENYKLLQAACGSAGRELCRVHQVHGAGVVRAARGVAFDVHQKADAIVSDDPARVVSVRVADCVPVLLSTADGRMVAAVHAGWRGVIAGVVFSALKAMEAGGHARPSEVIAAIGPSISGDAFEVGPEVVAEFRGKFGSAAPVKDRDGGKGSVDLREAIRLQLQRSGVGADQIDASDRCTFRDSEEFFSHRRDRGITGRMAAIIASNGAD